MAKNPMLKAAKKTLTNLGFGCEYQSDNSLTVYYPDDNVPFLFIILDTNEFPGLILNWAVDYLHVFEATEITIQLMFICTVANGEPFYFNKKGELFTGEHALLQFEMENTDSNFAAMEPASKEFH